MTHPVKGRLLTVGAAAFWDTVFSGLIPCRVEAIHGESGAPSVSTKVSIRLTDTVGPWQRGEVVDTNATEVVPRGAIRRGEFYPVVRPYRVEAAA